MSGLMGVRSCGIGTILGLIGALDMLYPYPKTRRGFRQRVVQTVT